jgi:hypothetical protein
MPPHGGIEAPGAHQRQPNASSPHASFMDSSLRLPDRLLQRRPIPEMVDGHLGDGQVAPLVALCSRFRCVGSDQPACAVDEGHIMDTCLHTSLARPNIKPSGQGCKECLAIGTRWVHLRLCMLCGHVGCCDDSPEKHATDHFARTGHPIIKSFEPGEDWWWCYVDESVLEPALPPRPDWTRRV